LVIRWGRGRRSCSGGLLSTGRGEAGDGQNFVNASERESSQQTEKRCVPRTGRHRDRGGRWSAASRKSGEPFGAENRTNSISNLRAGEICRNGGDSGEMRICMVENVARLVLPEQKGNNRKRI